MQKEFRLNNFQLLTRANDLHYFVIFKPLAECRRRRRSASIIYQLSKYRVHFDAINDEHSNNDDHFSTELNCLQ